MKLRLTLMCRDRELLDFEVDSATGAVGPVRVLDESCRAGGPGAPAFARGGGAGVSLMTGVQLLVSRRAISQRREDLPEILRATGAESAFELVFRSHGCSLSDQYWYRPKGSNARWADVNFHDNGWDPAFGEAVLARDWRALSRASLEAPDVTCNGAVRKAWVLDGGNPILLKAPPVNGAAFLESEVVVSRMLSRILAPGEFTSYRKVRRHGEDFAACGNMVGPTEEIVTAEALVGPVATPADGEGARTIGAFKRALDGLGVEGASRIAARSAVYEALVLTRDLNRVNCGAIRDVETGAYRAAPLFDYGGAFGMGLSPQGMRQLCENPVPAILAIARKCSGLDPDWDYSWYDPRALEGFDEELEGALSAIGGLPASYPQIVAKAFALQLEYVRGVAEQGKRGVDRSRTPAG